MDLQEGRLDFILVFQTRRGMHRECIRGTFVCTLGHIFTLCSHLDTTSSLIKSTYTKHYLLSPIQIHEYILYIYISIHIFHRSILYIYIYIYIPSIYILYVYIYIIFYIYIYIYILYFIYIYIYI
jgi:hypothetical protein